MVDFDWLKWVKPVLVQGRELDWKDKKHSEEIRKMPSGSTQLNSHLFRDYS